MIHTMFYYELDIEFVRNIQCYDKVQSEYTVSPQDMQTTC